jgi:oligoribonuclease
MGYEFYKGHTMSDQPSNLVWIDLEMTGLDPNKDVILEVASLVTDSQLTIIEEGPTFVIQHPEHVLQSMSSWSQKQHEASGLIAKVREEGVSLAEAEQKTLAFLMQHCKKGEALLCGNSVWQDRAFMVPAMPKIIEYLHYRLIDVTSIKELVHRWYPDDPHVQFKKSNTHRAVEDIRESVAELRHYRKYFFV